jgi:hypothetical protein
MTGADRVGAGHHASENLGKCEALVAEAGSALAALPSDIAGRTLLANLLLVLEKQADALIFMRSPNFLSSAGLFLKAACAGESFSG